MSEPVVAIVAGHVSAIRAHTEMVTRAGQRRTRPVAEITTPGGTFVVSLGDADGLLDADVTVTVRRST